jgi:hypothetical protein
MDFLSLVPKEMSVSGSVETEQLCSVHRLAVKARRATAGATRLQGTAAAKSVSGAVVNTL